jgi:hypothetical protein
MLSQFHVSDKLPGGNKESMLTKWMGCNSKGLGLNIVAGHANLGASTFLRRRL